MGAFLDKPITTKHTETGEGQGMRYALSSMQGWRVDMEDAHTVQLSHPHLPELAIFAVFDGHGGTTVSKESAQRLVPRLVDVLKTATGDDDQVARTTAALRAALLTLDRELRKLPKLSTGEDRSGSTANFAIITPSHVYTVNCGDSRSILVRGGQVHHSTIDHKPADKQEIDRIYYAGGFIDMGRVCGNLAVSRALGDFFYKDRADLADHEQKISAAPDVSPIKRHEEDEFLLIACDGIWDVMTNEDAAAFVHDQLKAGVAHAQIAERMLDHCLVKGSKDNMSVILVFFEAAPKPVPGHVASFSGAAAAEGGANGSAGFS